jgi:hypothetical protein
MVRFCRRRMPGDPARRGSGGDLAVVFVGFARLDVQRALEADFVQFTIAAMAADGQYAGLVSDADRMPNRLTPDRVVLPLSPVYGPRRLASSSRLSFYEESVLALLPYCCVSVDPQTQAVDAGTRMARASAATPAAFFLCIHRVRRADLGGSPGRRYSGRGGSGKGSRLCVASTDPGLQVLVVRPASQCILSGVVYRRHRCRGGEGFRSGSRSVGPHVVWGCLRHASFLSAEVLARPQFMASLGRSGLLDP